MLCWKKTLPEPMWFEFEPWSATRFSKVFQERSLWVTSEVWKESGIWYWHWWNDQGFILIIRVRTVQCLPIAIDRWGWFVHMDMSTASDVMCPHDARLLNSFWTVSICTYDHRLFQQHWTFSHWTLLQHSFTLAREINGQCMDVLSGGGGGCCGPMVWDLSRYYRTATPLPTGVAAMPVVR